MPKLTDNQHREIAFWGMAMIVMGLPLSVFLVSVGTFVLAGNWLLEGNFKKRLKQFFTSPLSLVLISFYLMLCIGMLWTDDLALGVKDLRVKLPLLLMPLFLFTSKLPNRKRIQELLLLFVVACLVGVLFGMARYFGLAGEELLNKRHLSVFISHIRFGLMLVFAFFICAYFLYAKWREWSIASKVITTGVMLWILWFLIILEAFTAYAAFAAVLVMTALWLLLKSNNRLLKTSVFVTTVSVSVFGFLYVKSIAEYRFLKIPREHADLPWKTPNGIGYIHADHIPYTENGHRVWDFVCWLELEKEWPNRSSINFDSTDANGQEIRYTAIRYITSKGLPKDSLGLSLLSDQDIRHIEHGFTNFRHTSKLGIDRRIDQLLWAYQEYTYQQNANNSSTMQRWVYTQVGWEIFKEHPIFGVGTGDISLAYRSKYAENSHNLEPRFQGIAHNEFLAVAIVLGVLGLIVFLLMLGYPTWLYRRDFLYLTFMVIMVVSFLTDNTFDRQSGVTFFAFFNALLIVRREFAET
ncbi:MAG: hypothetical protein GC178_16450 [Flavobacteriales bacterium]|nr:hypothetical protein [Flavobacteriales bacterium]